MKKRCLLLDVFTDMPFTGNQLAVFPDADDLTSEQMGRLANEINYSETTFILQATDSRADFNIRIFTPKAEMPFAGHPTLGTAYALLNCIDTDLKGADSIRLGTRVGVIPLEVKGDDLWMSQNEPQFFDSFTDKGQVAELVGLRADDIADDLPIEEVSTGNVILMIPVKSLDAISKAAGNVNRMTEFFSKHNSMDPYLFTLETVDPQASVHTRLFAPQFGIIEDPATGSAAGPLVGYLLKHKVFGESFEIINEQGIEMGRPSKIIMKGDLKGGRYNIQIGGKCCVVGESVFEL